MHPQSLALRALAEKWDAVPEADRADIQSYIIELCGALGMVLPGPRGSGYEFAYPVSAGGRTGKGPHFIDLYRPGHFVLVARQLDEAAGMVRSVAPAYGRAKRLARQVPDGPPPHLLVMSVARKLLFWDRWTGEYGRLHAARTIDLHVLWRNERNIELLRALWEDPASLDPSAPLKRILPDVRITFGPEGREIALDEATIAAVVDALLKAGRGFRLYDPLYPSPSDPGAYITYMAGEGVWRMGLANHGWSGGPYVVEADVVCVQLRNLFTRGLLHTIHVDGLHSHLLEGPVGQTDMSRQLREIHGVFPARDV